MHSLSIDIGYAIRLIFSFIGTTVLPHVWTHLAHSIGMRKICSMMFHFALFMNNESHEEWLSTYSPPGFIKSRTFRGRTVC